MRDYRTIEIPLDVITSAPQILVNRGFKIASLGVLRMTAGTSDCMDVAFGSTGDFLPIIAALQSFNRTPPQDEDIYYQIRTAVAGGKVKFLLGLGGLSITDENDPENAIIEIRDLLQKFARAAGLVL